MPTEISRIRIRQFRLLFMLGSFKSFYDLFLGKIIDFSALRFCTMDEKNVKLSGHFTLLQYAKQCYSSERSSVRAIAREPDS